MISPPELGLPSIELRQHLAAQRQRQNIGHVRHADGLDEDLRHLAEALLVPRRMAGQIQ